ncbi:MAG: hypothetical protein E7241_07925 [Lachnospiraceae bacterium]|nr:hypothetical protein [Lachnospiraceae bacterium]
MGAYLKRGMKVLLIVMLVCILWPGNVEAGYNADGNPGHTEYNDGGALTATTIVMKNGQTYNLSEYEGATYLECNSSGTFTVTGYSNCTMIVTNLKAGDDAKIVFNNAEIVCTTRCPGAPANARSVIEVTGSGGTLTLYSKGENEFQAKGGRPAIRKDYTDVRLVFDGDNDAVMNVMADSGANKTSAIGCYSCDSIHRTFGNVEFKGGTINAYGSSGIGGGPGIGADMFGEVNGLTFSGATIHAYAGSASAACIGTASCYIFNIFTDFDRAPYDCKNIEITGGYIETHPMEETSFVYGGAGIGGGWGCSADGIRISGGTVRAVGSLGAAGIGAGMDGDGTNIEIKGDAVVYAIGEAAGIGAARASGPVCGVDKIRYGEASVYISENANVTAYGGMLHGKPNSSGVGIGGGKNKYYEYGKHTISQKSCVEISGGKVRAYGTGDCPGIGAGHEGYMNHVTISGGDVFALGGKNGASIGSARKGTDTNCWRVFITGGTIVTRDGNAPEETGSIGGVNANGIHEADTDVFVSGGNLKAKLERGTAKVSLEDGRVVIPKEVAINTYAVGENREERAPVEAIGFSSNYNYGIKDVSIFEAHYDTDPVLYVWLPEDVTGVTEITMKNTLFKHGPVGEEEKVFKNLVPDSGTKTTLYPKVWFFFDDNYETRDTNTACASCYIGETKASYFKAENNNATPIAYCVDKELKKSLLNSDETFNAGILGYADYDTLRWTDSSKHMLINDKDNPDKDWKMSLGFGLRGIKLYGEWGVFDGKFHLNKPANATPDGHVASGGETWHNKSWSSQTVKTPYAGYELPYSYYIPGYDFLGWSIEEQYPGPGATLCEANGEYNITILDKWKGKRVINLYAQWKPKTYTVHFVDEDGSTTLMNDATYDFDADGRLPIMTQTKQDKVFVGWTGTALGSMYEDGASFKNLCGQNFANAEVTLKAVWKDKDKVEIGVVLHDKPWNSDQVTVKLIAGTNEISLQRGEGGWYTADNIPAGEYTVEIKWGSLKLYTNNRKITVTQGAASKSIFEYCNISIAKGDDKQESPWIIDQMTGEEMSSAYVLCGTDITIGMTPKKGYKFDKYTYTGVIVDTQPDKANKTITVYGSGAPGRGLDITSYAKAIKYTVKFDANGGSGTMADQEMIYNETQHLFHNAFARKGYTFDGWNTKADGSGMDLSDGEGVNSLADQDNEVVTLYAKWKVIEYNLGISNGKDNNFGIYTAGPDNGLGTILLRYTITQAVTIPNPVYTDHDFVGWLGTDLYEATRDLVLPAGTYGSREYTAFWEVKAYKVYFDTDGGSFVEEQAIMIHDKAIEPAPPTKEGYTFEGWYMDAERTVKYDFDSEVTADITLYAKWSGSPLTKDMAPVNIWGMAIISAAGIGYFAYKKKKTSQ